MQSKSPIKTQEQYIDCLNEIYLLLQKNIRLNSRSYIKLGICCVLVNHYQNGQFGGIPPLGLKIYSKIRKLLQDEKKERMMKRLGIQFMTDTSRSLLLDRKTFRLMPEILPGTQHL